MAPDGSVLGKPVDAADAARMLRLLSGSTHRVLSAIVLIGGGITEPMSAMVETRVTFAALPESAVEAYVATDEPYDKAGGYGFQGRAVAFIERVEGDPSSVIGLPLTETARLLTAAGVLLWNTAGDTSL